MKEKKAVKVKPKVEIIRSIPTGGTKHRYAPVTCMAKQMSEPFSIDGYEYKAGDWICHSKGNGGAQWFHGMTADAFKFFKSIG